MLPPLPEGCALAAIASASCYFFDNNHTSALLNIYALHVQYGIQAFAKFQRPECARLHLRELQSQKFSLGSIRTKLPIKVPRLQS